MLSDHGQIDIIFRRPRTSGNRMGLDLNDCIKIRSEPIQIPDRVPAPCVQVDSK